MKSVPAPISFAGSHLCETRHVCALFNHFDEEYRILLPFIKDGLKSIGGILQQNPFFVPPDEFLRDFRQRRASRNASPAMA